MIEYLAKLCDAICAKIEVLTESHDIFKASSEEKCRAVGSVRSEGQGVIGSGLVGADCARLIRTAGKRVV